MKENYPAVHRSIRKKFPIKNVILITNQDNKDSNSLAQKYIVLPLLRRYSNDVSSVTMDKQTISITKGNSMLTNTVNARPACLLYQRQLNSVSCWGISYPVYGFARVN